ncbi:uncharacterized protein PHALS_00889 [Plasmopara halstedii]|uniref:Uncharacterized protein n=1 Tax=Plasmopara halstedii TaxID=4781 RepID=A0A0P1AUG8_PLAHL|nr:uncharacterized protein PHALS_00889 [Plasmopara halstedii]CEG44533.1 hypothetical protein PHALS_00889 [Plasmopara halstedii]|eukprot:XP_024580902.1 hypothetical protein PHALS_00889 [Plasmopara halstedii]
MVVAELGLAYTPKLPRMMRTHSVFYMGLLKPYLNPAQLNAEALAPGLHQEAGPATSFEYGVQRFPFSTAPGAHPTHGVTNSSARRPGAAPTERDSAQRDAFGVQSASSSRGFPHSGMRHGQDAQQSSDGDGPCPGELEEHRESPDGGRPGRHRPPPTLLEENGDVHYHVERLVRRRRQ